MNIVYKKIDELKGYDKNAKIHTLEQVQKVANSIKEFGFNQPIVIDKNNVIVVGHGRLEAARLLKLKQVPCILKDDLNENQVKAYRLADNRLNESEWNMSLVLDEYNELDIDNQELTGFKVDDFKIDLKEEKEDILKEKKEGHECPKCGFEF